MNLQLGRSRASLIALVAAHHQHEPAVARKHADLIANAILFGARDRGRGTFTRTLYDQQLRTAPMSSARPARKRPPTKIGVKKSGKKSAGKNLAGKGTG